MEIESSSTCRGFGYLKFRDFYNSPCSVQESNIATENAIWFGVDDPNPQIMASDARKLGIQTLQTVGWVPYPIPEEVSIWTRMHLTQEQVKRLLPILTYFAATGKLPSA